MRVSSKMSVVFVYLNTFNQNTSFKHFVIINADFLGPSSCFLKKEKR